MKTRLVGARLFHAEGRTDRETNTTTLVVFYFFNWFKNAHTELPGIMSVRLHASGQLPPDGFS
jgi:hypothetical protein